jgi:hypothetical protein
MRESITHELLECVAEVCVAVLDDNGARQHEVVEAAGGAARVDHERGLAVGAVRGCVEAHRDEGQ